FHLPDNLFLGHGASHPGMVFMSVGTPEHQSFPIEVKGTLFFEFKMSETYFLFQFMGSPIGGRLYPQGVQGRIFWGPQFGLSNFSAPQLLILSGGLLGSIDFLDQLSLGIVKVEFKLGIGQSNRIVLSQSKSPASLSTHLLHPRV